MHSVKEMFPDGINEILVFNEYDEDEVDGENWKWSRRILNRYIRVFGFS